VWGIAVPVISEDDVVCAVGIAGQVITLSSITRSAGQTATLGTQTLGYEWDEPVDNGFQPPGVIDMSKTCEDVAQLLLDPRSDVGPGHACNSQTLYRAASGALAAG